MRRAATCSSHAAASSMRRACSGGTVMFVAGAPKGISGISCNRRCLPSISCAVLAPTASSATAGVPAETSKLPKEVKQPLRLLQAPGCEAGCLVGDENSAVLPQDVRKAKDTKYNTAINDPTRKKRLALAEDRTLPQLTGVRFAHDLLRGAPLIVSVAHRGSRGSI